jgi:hypothetical protein
MAVYKLTVRLAHTTGTYVPRSLYTHLEYNDTAHDTLLTQMCDKLLTQLFSVPPVKTLVYCWKVGPSRFLVKKSASLTAPTIHVITSTPACFSLLGTLIGLQCVLSYLQHSNCWLGTPLLDCPFLGPWGA